MRISLPLAAIYLLQEPEAVAAMWKNTLLSSPLFIYTAGLPYLFGMKDKQDDASLASTDLGLAWASVTNVVPSAMMAVLLSA